MKKRNRAKQATSLHHRLTEEASRLRQRARDLPAGEERSRLLHKARQMDEAADLDDFLTPDAAVKAPRSAP